MCFWILKNLSDKKISNAVCVWKKYADFHIGHTFHLTEKNSLPATNKKKLSATRIFQILPAAADF